MMQPIQELLSRIRWDRAFAQGSFEIDYEDHLQPTWVRLSLSDMVLGGGNSFTFDALDGDGVPVSIPLHRIRALYRNGRRIWFRNPVSRQHRRANV